MTTFWLSATAAEASRDPFPDRLIDFPRPIDETTMTTPPPHYLLFAEASRNSNSAQTWRFVLQDLATHRRFCATDTEPAACGERIELLAVVRGLEALDGPARVTLVTKSRYVSRGIKSGLAEWRASDWQWERFGRTVPVRDHDLWRRVDRALEFHEVDCQAWHFEEIADEAFAQPPVEQDVAESQVSTDRSSRVAKKPRKAYRRPGLVATIVRPVQHAWRATA